MLEGLRRADEEDARTAEEWRTRERIAPQPHDEPDLPPLPGQLGEVEALFEAELAQLPPDASDAERRTIVLRTVNRIWDVGTPEQRQLLASLFDAVSSVLREERQSEPDCVTQPAPVSE